MNDSSTHRHRSRRRALTLVEMAVSIVLVGVGLVVALGTVGASKLSQLNVSTGRQGHMLAQDLMTEILMQDYEEPVDTPTFGRESGESDDHRSNYDDVDDYDGWSASPPQRKDGTDLVGLDDWERSVDVAWVNPSSDMAVVLTNTGVKRITVTVKYNNSPVATLVALKTIGLPPLEACCLADGSCEDLRAETCTGSGGATMGPDTTCFNTQCPAGPVVLMVVDDDDDDLSDSETSRKDLMESWGFSVKLIAASENQSKFNSAVTGTHAAYVSETITATSLGTKLVNTTIGVVNEEPLLIDDFGFASGTVFQITTRNATVTDNTHYITSTLSLGGITITDSDQPLIQVSGGLAAGVRSLADVNGKSALYVADTGDELLGGTLAAGRRVQLPWGNTDFDIDELEPDGKTIMKRAIEWAAGMDVVAVACGDGTCDVGENCITCSSDCDSKISGNPASRYCCGNGIAESAEGDGSICDGNY